MLEEFIKALFLVFTAEMGDKTQIIAMTFATQYKVKDVLAGVGLGVFLNHGIAIVLGSFIAKVLPMHHVQIIAGVLFVIFGINALKIDGEDEIDNRRAFNPIVTVAMAFFIGELGDKTQLTAMTLSAEGFYPMITLLGTTMGMIATSSLGIFIGSTIGPKIPEVAIKIASSLVFIIFGSVKLFVSLPVHYITPIRVAYYLVIILLVENLLINRLLESKRSKTLTKFEKVATNLYEQTRALKETLDSICLGEIKCGKCSGKDCLIGYTRHILIKARNENEYYTDLKIDMDKFRRKDYDKSKVLQALILIIREYKRYGWDNNDDFIVNKIKATMEFILFGKSFNYTDGFKTYIKEIKKTNYKYGRTIEKECN